MKLQRILPLALAAITSIQSVTYAGETADKNLPDCVNYTPYLAIRASYLAIGGYDPTSDEVNDFRSVLPDAKLCKTSNGYYMQGGHFDNAVVANIALLRVMFALRGLRGDRHPHIVGSII